MSNKKSYIKVQPKGTLRYHTFNGDLAGCGFIRTIWPSILLHQWKYKNFRIHSTYGMHVIGDPSFYKGMAWVKFQRSAEDHQLEYIKDIASKVKLATGTKLIYEVDDLLTPDIPKTNYAHEYYAHYWENVKNILRTVDAMTVSTEPLVNVYKPYCENITVLPNHLPKFIWGEEEWKNHENKKPRILYAGSANHFNPEAPGGDFGPKLIKFIMDTVERFQWVFVGGIPFELQPLCGHVIEYHPWQTITNLPTFLKSLKIDIGLAPLEDNLFNRCKSNIKMLEYSALGIPGIYSNVTPYRKAMYTCDVEEYMIDRIETLVYDVDLRKKVWETDKATVRDQLYWEDNDNLFKFVNKHLKLFGKELA